MILKMSYHVYIISQSGSGGGYHENVSSNFDFSLP